ncbi:DUF2258 domain-containing protein [Aeropyrum camini]|uniref:Uncharacterized protein conserved in archaea n=1 Tax=Aeropyrum camini SY1 = JCM 12091 TaxID=1198449 RepID=U3TF51_9CREN|nr:single- stranded DNA-binding family protein [Aeropyrum camini]BAN90640.1 uncharacterized protein conserved in archaea [Aeropyrum camini SY1 = JCM 12091]
MPTLRTGLVIAAGYADKVRRVLFAQLRDAIKSGELSNKDVAMAAGNLNRVLFELLVNKLKADKLDVVRIQIDYHVKDSQIQFDFSTLRVELWRRVPEEEIAPVVEDFAKTAPKLLEEEIRFTVERVGETDVGDIVYRIMYRGSDVGALIVTPLNGEALVRGAVVEPTPLVLKRTRVQVEPGDLDDFISDKVSQLFAEAQNVEKREAVKVVNEILALVKAGETVLEEIEEAES